MSHLPFIYQDIQVFTGLVIGTVGFVFGLRFESG